jgi:hypothetical protein
MDNSSATTYGEELPRHLIEAVHKLIQAGASHLTISSVLGLKLEEVQLILGMHPSQTAKIAESITDKSRKAGVQSNRLMTLPVTAADDFIQQSHPEALLTMQSERVTLSTERKAKISEVCMESSLNCTQDLLAPQLHEDTLPTFIYAYDCELNRLEWTNLITGEYSSHQIPSYEFCYGSRLSEMHGGKLLITGREYFVEREVVLIDTRREFAVSLCPPMLTPRGYHAAVYHTQYLYVLGGKITSFLSESESECESFLSECERYVCSENRWESLPPLPRSCSNTSGVVIEKHLYALGGYNGSVLDLVQKLSLESLTWKLMRLRLPYADNAIPCFKLRDTEVYLVIKKTLLFCFTGLQITPIKTLTKDIWSSLGMSYYSRGTLYYYSFDGEVRSYEIGSLSN